MQPLCVYKSPIPNVAFGELLMIILISILILDMIIEQHKVKISTFFVYVIYALITSSIVFTLTGIGNMESIRRLLRDGFYLSLFFIFGINYFNYEYGIKLYKSLTCMLSIYIILQFIIYRLFGLYLTGFIPFFDISVSGNILKSELISHYLKSASIDGYLRPNGFLLEPAACAQYLAPSLILYLFKSNNSSIKDFEYKKIALITIGMILTVSANAYVSLILIYFIWVTSIISKKRISKKLFLAIAILIIAGILFLMFSNIGKDVINRFLVLGSNTQTQGSSSIRVMRGMAFYFAIPVKFQIFGIGFGNFMQFKTIYNINTIYETVDEYMNTNAYILISVGLIGFLIYIYFVFKFTKNKKFQSKVLVYLLLLFGLSSSIYSTPTFILILLLIYFTPYKYNYFKQKNIT
jgi:hypothetical protein